MPAPIHTLRETPEMQAGFEALARMVLNSWAQRIISFGRDRDRLESPWDLAAIAFDDVALSHRRDIRRLPPRLQSFVRHAKARHLRVAAEPFSGSERGSYNQRGAGQPEIILTFDGKQFTGVRDAIRQGAIYPVLAFLSTRFSTLVHELVHAYDDFASGGKFDQNVRSNAARQAKTEVYGIAATPQGRADAQRLYLTDPIEINARFFHTVTELRYQVQKPWPEFLQAFKMAFNGWRLLSPADQRRLYARLASEWMAHQPTRQVDIRPFVTKLNTTVQAEFGKDIWITGSDDSIEISGLDTLKPRPRAVVLEKACFLADILRITITTYDQSPMLREFGFRPNRGRSKNYRFSAPMLRPPRARALQTQKRGV